MKKAATLTISVCAGICLFVIIVFTCIQSVAFNENLYASGQERLGLATKAGVSQADMNSVMHELLLYCQGDRSDLNMQVQINGQMREVFSDREKAHMVDVQRLFVRGFKLRTILIISFLFLLLLLISVVRWRTVRELSRGWIFTVIGLGALLAVVGVCFAVNFDAAWTEFHHIFFTNDLWLLYDNDMLILMLMPLFDGIVRAVLAWSAASLAVVTGLAVLALKLTKKQKTEPAADELE